MKHKSTTTIAGKIMLDYAHMTGLIEQVASPGRYLWTDAFAVCNFLGLYTLTNDEKCLDLAIHLVDQVHFTLGRHRADDPRSGWISGLEDGKGHLHPTIGGLRIGKPLKERTREEIADDYLEWERDGQYYHYLTRWMYALFRVSAVTGDLNYTLWAVELARRAHSAFSYVPLSGGKKRMYWKMSIDLSYPLVFSMGMHDPLDGLITYNELQTMIRENPESYTGPDLRREISDIENICQGMNLTTDDPLGTGGLMIDAFRLARLIRKGNRKYKDLLINVLDSALAGLHSFTKSGALLFPAGNRIPFREFGLSTGLKAIEAIAAWFGEDSDPPIFKNRIKRQIESFSRYAPLSSEIEHYWMDERNRKAATWVRHREINMVMLATSLEPEGLLGVGRGTE
jgi:hypothetical protein